MLKEFIEQFTDHPVIDHTKVVQIRKRFYLGEVPKNEPTYTGAFMGEIINKKFKPSFILLDLLGTKATKAIIDDKQAWLFVCGRDILEPDRFKEGLKPQVLDQVDNKLVLVVTEKDEVLGFGKNNPKYHEIKNILDRGDFLRRER